MCPEGLTQGHAVLLPGPEEGKWAAQRLRAQQQGLWEGPAPPHCTEGDPLPWLQAARVLLGLEPCPHAGRPTALCRAEDSR